MTSETRLSKDKLEKLRTKPLPQTLEEMINAFESCEVYMNNSPSYVSFDLQNYEPIVSSEKRQFRIHDNSGKTNGGCVICKGFEGESLEIPTTTPVIHYTGNEEEFSFTNMNMFPGATPKRIAIRGKVPRKVREFSGDNFYWGLHTLTWVSNHHKDIHQLSEEEHYNCLKEIVSVQKIILSDNENGLFAHVIKNSGAIAGCSLEHGHYQMLFNNFPSGRQIRDVKFFEENGISYTEFLRRDNQKRLDVESLSSREFRTIVPVDSKRAYEVIILPNKRGVRTLRELFESENSGRELSSIIRDYSRGLYEFCEEKNKNFGYNLFVVEGLDENDIRIHIKPSTQMSAGLEYAGCNLRQKSLEKSKEELERYVCCSRKKSEKDYSIVPN